MDCVLFAQKIKELCSTKNITLKTMLSDCGLNRNFMYDLKVNNQYPTIDRVERIADYFNVSIDYLIGRDARTWKHGYKL